MKNIIIEMIKIKFRMVVFGGIYLGIGVWFIFVLFFGVGGGYMGVFYIFC